ESAGVAKPTLYYYFQSKEGLARALVRLPLANLVEQLRQIVTTEPDPVVCLERILEAHFAFCREDPDRSRFLYALIFGPPGSEPAHDLECCKEDLVRWIEKAISRRERVWRRRWSADSWMVSMNVLRSEARNNFMKSHMILVLAAGLGVAA